VKIVDLVIMATSFVVSEDYYLNRLDVANLSKFIRKL